MPGRAGRSIGEVLEELRNDFPDVSVSKIRFLESQGLINPGRTPSGYRQFSDDDLNLLRWILRQQRENYLPLKVIRRRLRDGEGPGAEAPDRDGAGDPEALAELPVEAVPEAAAAEETVWFVPGSEALTEAPSTPQLPLDVAPELTVPGGEPSPEDDLWPPARPDASYSRADLARQSGLDEWAVDQLESFGILCRSPGGDFDGESREVADIAARFFGFGVEARHLRMYKSFAEREAAFLQQVVMPMLKARHEDPKAQARQALAELARLGQALRLSMLRAALGPPPGE